MLSSAGTRLVSDMVASWSIYCRAAIWLRAPPRSMHATSKHLQELDQIFLLPIAELARRPDLRRLLEERGQQSTGHGRDALQKLSAFFHLLPAIAGSAGKSKPLGRPRRDNAGKK